jgi:hypothetical protein
MKGHEVFSDWEGALRKIIRVRRWMPDLGELVLKRFPRG